MIIKPLYAYLPIDIFELAVETSWDLDMFSAVLSEVEMAYIAQAGNHVLY